VARLKGVISGQVNGSRAVAQFRGVDNHLVENRELFGFTHAKAYQEWCRQTEVAESKIFGIVQVKLDPESCATGLERILPQLVYSPENPPPLESPLRGLHLDQEAYPPFCLLLSANAADLILLVAVDSVNELFRIVRNLREKPWPFSIKSGSPNPNNKGSSRASERSSDLNDG